MDKQNVACSCTGMLFAIKRTKVLTPATKRMNLENIMLVTKEHVSCDSIYIKYPKYANVLETESRLLIALDEGIRELGIRN